MYCLKGFGRLSRGELRCSYSPVLHAAEAAAVPEQREPTPLPPLPLSLSLFLHFHIPLPLRSVRQPCFSHFSSECPFLSFLFSRSFSPSVVSVGPCLSRFVRACLCSQLSSPSVACISSGTSSSSAIYSKKNFCPRTSLDLHASSSASRLSLLMVPTM